MGLVQIEETELSNLRKERDEVKAKVEQLSTESRDLTSKVEKAEAEATKEKEGRETAEKKVKDLEEAAQRTSLKDTRLAKLGDGFMAKLGEFTKERLTEAAGTLSDEDWEAALKEKEEMAGVTRDTKADASSSGSGGSSDGGGKETAATGFSQEEVASFMGRGTTRPATSYSGADGTSAVRKLASAFAPTQAKGKEGDS